MTRLMKGLWKQHVDEGACMPVQPLDGRVVYCSRARAVLPNMLGACLCVLCQFWGTTVWRNKFCMQNVILAMYSLKTTSSAIVIQF